MDRDCKLYSVYCISTFVVVCFAVIFNGILSSSYAFAQETPVREVSEGSGNPDVVKSLYKVLDHQNNLKAIEITPEYIRTIPTLFFTKWQHALLVETRAGARSRPISESELDGEGNVVKGPRDISLSGIVFSSKDKWTIWLNDKRVAPDAIPEEIMDINVSFSHVDIEWFDAYTNKIYPIRLRPHQRFNLDSRIFLPGAGVAN